MNFQPIYSAKRVRTVAAVDVQFVRYQFALLCGSRDPEKTERRLINNENIQSKARQFRNSPLFFNNDNGK